MARWHFIAFCFLAVPVSRAATNDHWAYQPLLKGKVPPVHHVDRVKNPIDHFVLARIEDKGIGPLPEADRRTLLRRVYFDLTGLPPNPEEVQTFLTNSAPDAYEQVVDHLLASPRYGERWARHWMDVVHFAETHGHDQDRIRTNAWPYRDYLIRSFNADKPYARFVEEQVAGDVLYSDEPDGTVALGLISAGPWDESSLRDIREDTLDRQIGRYLDRDDMVTTVMQTFTSTTVQCARCHDHKFDPIPQREYYALQAVFAGVDRANRAYDADPATHRRRQELSRMRKQIDRGDDAVLFSDENKRRMQTWEERRNAIATRWKVVEPQTFLSAGGATLKREPGGSLLATGTTPERDTYTISAASPLETVTAVRLEALADETLPVGGPGRQTNGNFHLSEFQLLLFERGAAAPREIALASPSADFDQSGWTVEHALDRNEKTAWGIHPQVGKSHAAVFPLKETLRVPEGATLVFVIKQLHGERHLIGRARLSATDGEPALMRAVPETIGKILAVTDHERTEQDRAQLASFVLKAHVAEQFAKLPSPSLVYAAAADFEPDGGLRPSNAPRLVHVLKRGEISKPLSPAIPGALSCVKAVAPLAATEEKEEGQRRAALARWLTDTNNPLTWRSIVNRVWQQHFGRGLVETPNDFGRMGTPPSHPELLDWLAVWFRDDAGGSMKRLHRLLVTSATYRQAVVLNGTKTRTATAASVNLDSENRLLGHMNRARLDAEQIRDAILQISHALDLRMGGPSDRQFDLQPGHHVTPRIDYTKFDVAATNATRRSIYRFLFRTLPDPFMDALDCPAGDQLTPVRNASVTVQQALALWNNAFVIHYAERFAQHLEQNGKSARERIVLAYESALNRSPAPDELPALTDYVEKHGLANFCRLLFNSNEFIFLN